MKKWSGSSVCVRLMLMVAISVASLLMVFGMALSSSRAIGLESVLSKRDRLMAFLAGDFETPLESVLNAYPIAAHAQTEKSREAIESARKAVHETRRSYERKFAAYDRRVTDSGLQAAIKDVQSAGEGWYDLLENEYFPALLEGRTDDALAIWQNRMEPLYRQHNVAIVKINNMVNSGPNPADESKYQTWMGVVTGPALIVVLFIGLVTVRYGQGLRSHTAL